MLSSKFKFQAARESLRGRLFAPQTDHEEQKGPLPRLSLEPADVNKVTFQGSADFSNKYKLLQTIGQGAHAIVKKSIRKSDNKTYAVKIFRTGDPETVNTIKQTFQLNCSLKGHPSIIKAYELYIDEVREVVYFVMEYCEYPSLQQQMNQFPVERVPELLFEIAKVVEYMHQRGVCHRDLKPDNILVSVTQRIEIKLIDLGVSKRYRFKENVREMWTRTGTLFYQAPEIFNGIGYEQKVDLWSIGVMVYQLVCGHLPFQCDTILDTIETITEKTSSYKEAPSFRNLHNVQQDLIRRLLKRDPQKRLDAQEFRLHPYLKEGNNQKISEHVQDDADIQNNFDFQMERTQSTTESLAQLLNGQAELKNTDQFHQDLRNFILDNHTNPVKISPKAKSFKFRFQIFKR